VKTIKGGFPNQLVAPVQMHLFGKKLHQKDAEIPGEPITERRDNPFSKVLLIP